MEAFLIILFFCNIAYSQNSYYAMDTTIHKDEYYEMVYQLNQSRIKMDSLETELNSNQWRFICYENLLSVYKRELNILEKQLKRKNKKRNEKNILLH